MLQRRLLQLFAAWRWPGIAARKPKSMRRSNAPAAPAPRFPKPAQKTFWGGYAGYFADPDGHLWEVAHNPGFPLTDDGRLMLPD